VQAPGLNITYQHDAMGNRVAKLVDNQITEKYLWQGQTTLLAVFNADDSLKQRFEYTLGNTPTSFEQAGQKYYIVSDHLGSPRVITDSDGTIVKAMSYDSFGNTLTDSNPAFKIPFGFAGGLYDTDTGLIRFGYRDYDPETSKWTARDPIGLGDGPNIYAYVGNDPVNFTDPTGLFNLPSLPQGLVNALAGFGDALLWGQGDLLRDLAGVDGGVDQCSGSYKAGSAAAVLAGGARLAYAGLAKAGSILASSGTAASSFRAGLKTAFRGGVGRNWRPPNLSGKTQAQLRASAGRTNPGVNVYGAGVTVGGIQGISGEGG
jgi:RHS repeat-associated protein